MAAGVYKAAFRLKIAIPEELSVIGFDDSPVASRLSPALTTIHLPIRHMARLAASKLIPVSSRDEVEANGISRIAPHLVVRDSTQPPESLRTDDQLCRAKAQAIAIEARATAPASHCGTRSNIRRHQGSAAIAPSIRPTTNPARWPTRSMLWAGGPPPPVPSSEPPPEPVQPSRMIPATERPPATRPVQRPSQPLAPRISGHQPQRREYGRGGPDRAMVRRSRQSFEKIRQRGAGHDEEPGATNTDLPSPRGSRTRRRRRGSRQGGPRRGAG